MRKVRKWGMVVGSWDIGKVAAKSGNVVHKCGVKNVYTLPQYPQNWFNHQNTPPVIHRLQAIIHHFVRRFFAQFHTVQNTIFHLLVTVFSPLSTQPITTTTTYII